MGADGVLFQCMMCWKVAGSHAGVREGLWATRCIFGMFALRQHAHSTELYTTHSRSLPVRHPLLFLRLSRSPAAVFPVKDGHRRGRRHLFVLRDVGWALPWSASLCSFPFVSCRNVPCVGPLTYLEPLTLHVSSDDIACRIAATVCTELWTDSVASSLNIPSRFRPWRVVPFASDTRSRCASSSVLRTCWLARDWVLVTEEPSRPQWSFAFFSTRHGPRRTKKLGSWDGRAMPYGVWEKRRFRSPRSPPCFAKCFSLSCWEIVGVCALLASMLPTVAGAMQFMARLAGRHVRLGRDAFPIPSLFVLVSAFHMVSAIRWCAMLPLEILSLVWYAGLSLILSGHTRAAEINSTRLLVLLILMSVGKRRLELADRRFFMMIVSERTLRRVSACGAHHQSAPSAGSEMSAYSARALDTIQQIGRREHWLLQEEELQVSARVLGEGGFGVVLCRKFRGSPVAIKDAPGTEPRGCRGGNARPQAAATPEHSAVPRGMRGRYGA